ncbi:6446_t:CDS:1, partial [Cetraspora pellucida]
SQQESGNCCYMERSTSTKYKPDRKCHHIRRSTSTRDKAGENCCYTDT